MYTACLSVKCGCVTKNESISYQIYKLCSIIFWDRMHFIKDVATLPHQ